MVHFRSNLTKKFHGFLKASQKLIFMMLRISELLTEGRMKLCTYYHLKEVSQKY
jgi:hypothetical protein